MRGHRIAGNRDGNAGALLWRLMLVLALAPAAVLAGFGGSASAAVTGLEQVFATSQSNSSNKSVTVSCPSGKQVVGAGGAVGGGGHVAFGSIRPDAALTTVTVQGLEDETGLASNWGVRAYAICATPPPGLERVSAASPTDSANKAVTASCPAGKRLLGTGAEIDGGGGQVTLNEVIPGSSLKGATVQVFEDENGTAVDWQARAYAICSNPVAGLERVVGPEALCCSPDKTSDADCSAGKRVTGVGGELDGGGGEVILTELEPAGGRVTGHEDEDGTSDGWFVRAFAICAAVSERIVAVSTNDSLNKNVTAGCFQGQQVTGGGGHISGGGGQVLIDAISPSATSVGVFGQEDETGIASNWLLRGYAICATPLPGLEVVSNSSPTGSANPKSITAPCPTGKRVVGAGGEVVNGAGQVVLVDVAPNAALTAVDAAGFEDENGYANRWTVTAHAVCANPPPGLELVSAQSDPDSDFSASVPATCPSPKHLLGTGAEIDGAAGEVVLDQVRPNRGLTRVIVSGLEDETGLASDWTVTAHAICANP